MEKCEDLNIKLYLKMATTFIDTRMKHNKNKNDTMSKNKRLCFTLF